MARTRRVIRNCAMSPAKPSRRHLLAGLAACAVARLPASRALAQESRLAPGQFSWNPDRSPDGPVAIIVSIPDQLVHVYRNAIEIGLSTCSTGRPGHPTPTGVFTILQKQVDHHSNIYGGAEMADMERLTWTGIALHVGGLPGYPSSHGCVHLPRAFSDKLYGITHVGTAVIIADDATAPAEIIHPGLVLTQDAEEEIDAALRKAAARPIPTTGQPVSILVSSADRRFDILQGGDTVASGSVAISDPSVPLGSHVLVFTRMAGRGLVWQAVSHGGGQPGTATTNVLARLQVDAEGRKAIATHLHPGALLITTDRPLSPDTRSGSGFTILTS
jgi:hypothetical protein